MQKNGESKALTTEQPAISPQTESAKTQFLALLVPVTLGAYLLITSTVHLSETLWKFDVKRILELCLLPLIFSVVLFSPGLKAAFQHQISRLPKWMAWALGAIVVLGVISAVHNSSSTWSLIYSLSEVALLSMLGVAVFCVAACRSAAGTLFDQTTVVLLAMVGLTVGLQELLGVLAALSEGLEFHPRIALLHFSWPRFYNQIQAWSMPVIAALPLLFPGKPLAKLLCASALALEWYVVIATGARGTAVGVIFAVLIALVLFPRIRKTMILYQGIGLLAGVLIYAAVAFGHQALPTNSAVSAANTDTLSEPAPYSVDRNQNQSTDEEKAKSIALQKMGESSGDFMEPITGQRMWTSSGRTAMWRGSIEDAKSYPLLGIGPMNYACKGPTYRAGHPHSFPLQFLSEWGTPAFLLLLAIGAYAAFALVRALRKPGSTASESPELAAYFATGVLSALILSGVDGVFIMPESQVAGVLVGGALLGMFSGGRGAATAAFPNGTLRNGSTLVLLLALGISFAFLVFAEHEIRVSAERLEQTELMDRGIPRLWQNGKVCVLYQ